MSVGGFCRGWTDYIWLWKMMATFFSTKIQGTESNLRNKTGRKKVQGQLWLFAKGWHRVWMGWWWGRPCRELHVWGMLRIYHTCRGSSISLYRGSTGTYIRNDWNLLNRLKWRETMAWRKEEIRWFCRTSFLWFCEINLTCFWLGEDRTRMNRKRDNKFLVSKETSRKTKDHWKNNNFFGGKMNGGESNFLM